MSDREARNVITEWNRDHPDQQVEYDFERESGREFNAETMQLEDKPVRRFSKRKKTEEKLNNQGEDVESEQKDVSLPKKDVRYGKTDIERVFSGNDAIARTLEETSDPGVRHSPAEEAGRGGRKKESVLRTLVQRAQENGTWHERIEDIAGDYIGEGQENHVYLSKDGKDVIKINNFAFVPKDASDLSVFVDRLRAHNELFPSEKMELLGFTHNAKGEVSAIIKQPFVDAEREATDAEIDAFLEDHDFTVDMTDEWSDGKYGIIDLKPSNVLSNNDGRLRFIDVVVRDMDRQQKRIKLQEEGTRFRKGGEQNPVEAAYERNRKAGEKLAKSLNMDFEAVTDQSQIKYQLQHDQVMEE